MGCLMSGQQLDFVVGVYIPGKQEGCVVVLKLDEYRGVSVLSTAGEEVRYTIRNWPISVTVLDEDILNSRIENQGWMCLGDYFFDVRTAESRPVSSKPIVSSTPTMSHCGKS